VNNISKSPNRHTFQRDGYIKRCKEEGKEPDASIIEMYESWANKPEYENRPINDLEYDLRTTEWILEKTRANDNYAQNIYAALCNMRWQKLDTFPILKDEYWSCSWRHAGGIVADMQQKGDYIDWYCSGIGGGLSMEDSRPEGYVSEATVTEEIRADFQKIGWIPSEWPDD
jgi:hypothetical protein